MPILSVLLAYTTILDSTPLLNIFPVTSAELKLNIHADADQHQHPNLDPNESALQYQNAYENARQYQNQIVNVYQNIPTNVNQNQFTNPNANVNQNLVVNVSQNQYTNPNANANANANEFSNIQPYLFERFNKLFIRLEIITTILILHTLPILGKNFDLLN